MRMTQLGSGNFEFDFQGAGQPVLLLDGAVLDDALTPVRADLAAQQGLLTVRYHRRGYGGSSPHRMPWSIGQQAGDAAALLKHLGIRRAHLVTYSYGAAIGLQFAIDHPELTATLALLEPMLLASVRSGGEFRRELRSVAHLYGRGETAQAAEAYLLKTLGPDYRRTVEQALGPAAFDRAIAGMGTFFEYELSAFDVWPFTPSLATRIEAPVLSIIGTESAAPFWEAHELLMKTLPKAEELEIPGANHALPMTCAAEIARTLMHFFRRHAIVAEAKGRVV